MDATMIGVPITLATTAMGTVCLPWLTDRSLKGKFERMDRFWYQMLDECAKGKPLRREASQWLARQRVALSSGKLCRQRAEALLDRGLAEGAKPARTMPDLESEKARFALRATPLTRLLCAMGALAFPLMLTLAGAPAYKIALGALIGAMMTYIVACDVRARIIPYQACVAYGVLGVLWALPCEPLELLERLALAIAAAAALWLVEKVAIRLTRASAIGAGDRRLIPLIFFQVGLSGVYPGMVAACAVSLALAAIVLMYGGTRRSYLPFAPALMACSLAGTLWPLVGSTLLQFLGITPL